MDVAIDIFRENKKRTGKGFGRRRLGILGQRGTNQHRTHLRDADGLTGAGEHSRDSNRLGEGIELVRLEAVGVARAGDEYLPELRCACCGEKIKSPYAVARTQHAQQGERETAGRRAVGSCPSLPEKGV